ncbi:MAG: hypothetical protein M3Q27_04095 [Actinomycetota bacterium]|nr:hypothetical protein [Actinomycetota bacterium]
MSPRRQRAALAATVAALVPLVAACGAGADAITNRPYAPADGVMVTVDGARLKVLNALVIAPAQGSSDAVISMAVNNRTQQPERILAISAGELGKVRLAGEKEIPPAGMLLIGGANAAANAIITGFKGKPGQVVPLEVQFEQAGTVVVRTVAYPPVGAYATVTPSAATPTAKTTPPATTDATPTEPAPGVDTPTPKPSS